MIQIQDLSKKEIDELVAEVRFGHLGCCLNEKPYVVPIHYVVHEGQIVIYTTEGRKSEIISENPNVCLQIEQIRDNEHWASVIVEGTAERIDDAEERRRAFAAFRAGNPTLTPAISIHWMDSWIRENIDVIYRINETSRDGRRSADR